MKVLSALFVLLFPAFLIAQDNEPSYYIHSIYFGGGSYYIDDQQTQELQDWLLTIPNIDDTEITIHSHTDNIGSKEYNEWLSQMRSRAAIIKLLEQGIPRELMSIEDFGELNPVYDNSTWEGKLKNRRVDIIIHPVIL
jgi:outer membrane protein OmpA-like peptidoglycan-associated protein